MQDGKRRKVDSLYPHPHLEDGADPPKDDGQTSSLLVSVEPMEMSHIPTAVVEAEDVSDGFAWPK